MNQQAQPSNSQQAKSCLGKIACNGCAAIGLLVVLMIGLTLWNFAWRRCRIPLPDKSGSVTFLARLSREPNSHSFVCKIRFNTSHFHEKWLNAYSEGENLERPPLKVYWYAATVSGGPYLRFFDGCREALVDIRHGTTLLILRMDNGDCLSGPIQDPWFTDRQYNDRDEITKIGGQPVKKIPDSLAQDKGMYIGQIDVCSAKFIPAK